VHPKVSFQLCVVERLTIISWLTSIFPFLLRSWRKGYQTVYFIDDSAGGVVIARLTARLLKISVEQLQFRYEDVRDERGDVLGLRIRYDDFFRVQQWIAANPLFQSVLRDGPMQGRIPVYLKKQIAFFAYTDRSTLLRGLLLVRVAEWKGLAGKDKKIEPFLFMDRRTWMHEIQRYGIEHEVRVIPTHNLNINPQSLVVRLLGPTIMFFIRHVYFNVLARGWLQTIKQLIFKEYFATVLASNKNGVITSKQDTSPKIGVEYYGHHNLDRPELHSDLFFWQQSSLSGDDIVVMFNIPSDPVDATKATELRQHSMHAVALSPNASVVPSVPVFLYWPRLSKKPTLKIKAGAGYSTIEKRWIQDQLAMYRVAHNYWADLFAAYNIKVFISWFKYTAQHCVFADALQSIGGVTAIYQRAFEELPTAESAIASDIVFGFSSWNAYIERESGSIIPYHVAVGYFGDHRFKLLRKPAQEIRERMKKNGAKYIVAFFDENSAVDPRWLSGHEFMQKNYEFLLEKVLSEQWFGVVFKPKVPRTLRQRLGPVAEVLKRAEETGRCFVIEGGTLHGSYPPVIGALAADVAIHSSLYASTAGMEAALAGVPTLLMDRDGWSLSRLNELGKGKVVFNDWESLWDALIGYRSSKGNMKGFGDWSPLLDKIDPFRDGRAAERMGTYLKWLLDGFKAGLDRDTVMADAAERYCKIWGRDKITEIGATFVS
jgi:hypothetical protein